MNVSPPPSAGREFIKKLKIIVTVWGLIAFVVMFTNLNFC